MKFWNFGGANLLRKHYLILNNFHFLRVSIRLLYQKLWLFEVLPTNFWQLQIYHSSLQSEDSSIKYTLSQVPTKKIG